MNTYTIVSIILLLSSLALLPVASHYKRRNPAKERDINFAGLVLSVSAVILAIIGLLK